MSRGGILFGNDWDVIAAHAELALRRIGGSGIAPVLIEIGVDDGRTTRDLVGLIGRIWPEHSFYHAIDPREESPIISEIMEHQDPIFAGVFLKYHRGRSHEQSRKFAANSAAFVLVDGCHCAQCAARDGIMYGSLVRPGGLLLFHDAAPGTQGKDDQRYESMKGYHDEDEAAKGIQVRKFLDANLLAGFRLLQKAFDQDRGGVEVYEKI